MSLTVCQILAKPGSRQMLVKTPKKEFHENSSGGSWVLLWGQTDRERQRDRQTDRERQREERQ